MESAIIGKVPEHQNLLLLVFLLCQKKELLLKKKRGRTSPINVCFPGSVGFSISYCFRSLFCTSALLCTTHAAVLLMDVPAPHRSQM
jgi:hypothetical protein